MKIVIRLFFRYFFRTVRIILGPVMLLWEKVTTPKGVVRPDQEQQRIDQHTQKFVLYQFKTCPFCIKARRTIKSLSLNIETRDAQKNMSNREELLKGGGQIKVPCLRVLDDNGQTTWLYESSEISRYLQEQFAEA